ncbi:hypothetical protein EVAR_45341_1 [Eumeta japonica]|uniref:Uncharacterized protein n=1 Tax=Eumeta variegata TaxID=151549 RepID=A0A4C1XMG8_EUMVA|nr:hypothetical protein EVAR_45341_1 [Eumeta japonica]
MFMGGAFERTAKSVDRSITADTALPTVKESKADMALRHSWPLLPLRRGETFAQCSDAPLRPCPRAAPEIRRDSMYMQTQTD